MPPLALVLGYVLVALLGVIGFLIVRKMFTGGINRSYLYQRGQRARKLLPVPVSYLHVRHRWM